MYFWEYTVWTPYLKAIQPAWANICIELRWNTFAPRVRTIHMSAAPVIFIYKWDYGTTSDPCNLYRTPHPSMTPWPCLDNGGLWFPRWLPAPTPPCPCPPYAPAGLASTCTHRRDLNTRPPTHSNARTHARTHIPPTQCGQHIWLSVICYWLPFNPIWPLLITWSGVWWLCVSKATINGQLIPIVPIVPHDSTHVSPPQTVLWCSGVEVRA